MSRRLELRKERVQARELMTVREDNIKEVVEVIAEVIVTSSEENIWEAVNTMLRVDTDTSVLDCVYKMVSNKLGFTKYCISNPFEVEPDRHKDRMSRIKALLISKEIDGKIFSYKDTTLEYAGRVQTLSVKRLNDCDIHIFRIDDTFGVHMYSPYREIRGKSESQIIEWLDKEIS